MTIQPIQPGPSCAAIESPARMRGRLLTLLLLLAALLLSCRSLTPDAGVRRQVSMKAHWSDSQDSRLPESPVLTLGGLAARAGFELAAFDLVGRRMVTLGLDGSLSVWNLGSHSVERVIRLPRGTHTFGRITALALDPEGRRVVAGWRGVADASIYAVDLDTGRIQQRADGLPDTVTVLKFSPDARMLAAGMATGGIRLFDAQLNNAFSITVDDVAPYVTDLDFDATGRFLMFVRIGGQISRWDLNTRTTPWQARETQLTVLSELKRVATLARHVPQRPDLVLIGGTRGSMLFLGQINGANLHLAGQVFLPDPDFNATITNISFGQDGRRIVIAGISGKGQGFVATGLLQYGAKGVPERIVSGHTHSPGGTGQLFIADRPALPVKIASRNGAIAQWTLGSAGNAEWTTHRTVANRDCNQLAFGAMPKVLSVSNNGLTVALCRSLTGTQEAPTLIHHIGARDPTADKGSGALAPPRMENGGIRVADDMSLRDGASFTSVVVKSASGSHRLEADLGEDPMAVAVMPISPEFAIATSQGVYFGHVNPSGYKLQWAVSTPARALNISGDGRLVVAEGTDEVIRWYRTSNGELALSLYVSPDGSNWVRWTPSGYFDSSGEGDQLLGWLVNKGLGVLPEYHPIWTFRAHYHRPGIVARVLASPTELQAIQSANEAEGLTAPAGVAQLLPPVVTVLSPSENTKVSSRDLTVRLRISTPSDAPATELIYRVNGRLPTAEGRGLQRQHHLLDGERDLVVRLPIDAEDFQIDIVAGNKNGNSAPTRLHLVWAGGAPRVTTQPVLHVLAIGVGSFTHTGIPTLRYPAKDARDMATALQALAAAPGRPGYRRVEVQTLQDQQATRAAILNGLRALRDRVQPEDHALVLLAGHGTTGPGSPSEGQTYHFLSQDSDPAKLAATAVGQAALLDNLSAIRGRILLLVDTCHAAGLLGKSSMHQADHRSLGQALLRKAVNSLTASDAGQLALESAQIGNGLFTRATLEGLSGKARGPSGAITSNSLADYVQSRTKDLSRDSQVPQYFSIDGAPFVLVPRN